MNSAPKKFVFNMSSSADNNSSDEQERCYSPTKQPSASRSTQVDDEDDQQNESSLILSKDSANFSKLLRQKEMKIVKVNQKLKVCQKQLQALKIKCQHNQNDLFFFKAKLKQQIDKNQKIEAHFELINKTLIQTVRILSAKSINTDQHSSQSQTKIIEIQSNHNSDVIALSQNILTLFEQQFDSFSEKIDLKMNYSLNNFTSHANNFTFNGQTSVPKLQFMNQDSKRSQTSGSQSHRPFLDTKTSDRQSMEQAFSNNGIQVEELIDVEGMLSIKSLSKFKMAEMCLKLAKKIKYLESKNQISKLVQPPNSPAQKKNQLLYTFAKAQQKTKKTGLRRLISMQQQI